MTTSEFARQLGMNADYLRQLIRRYELMPRSPGRPFVLEEEDRERIAEHPAVRLAVAGRRERAKKAL